MGQYEGYRVLAFHSCEENCYSSLRLLGQDATNSGYTGKDHCAFRQPSLDAAQKSEALIRP
jgi:hypothetical protein